MIPVAAQYLDYPGLACDGVHWMSSFRAKWSCDETSVLVDDYVQKMFRILRVSDPKGQMEQLAIEFPMLASRILMDL